MVRAGFRRHAGRHSRRGSERRARREAGWTETLTALSPLMFVWLIAIPPTFPTLPAPVGVTLFMLALVALIIGLVLAVRELNDMNR